MSITTAQIRGARGILNWSQSDLAGRTGISSTSIGSIENGQSTPRASTLQTIRKTFEDSGIEFLGLDGVRQRNNNVRVYSGQAGFVEFFDLVHRVMKETGGEIIASNVIEKQFLHWADDTADKHMNRMSELDNVKAKILIQEGDFNFIASEYAEYRWIPKEQFASVPYYAFNDYLAIMLLDRDPVIVVLDYPAVADAFRIQFKALWDLAKSPEKAKAAS